MLTGGVPWDLDVMSLASVYGRRRGLASGEPASLARAEEERHYLPPVDRGCSSSIPPVVSAASQHPNPLFLIKNILVK